MSQSPATKEPQYSLLFDVKEKHGIARLGLMVNEFLESGPETHAFHTRALQVRGAHAQRAQARA